MLPTSNTLFREFRRLDGAKLLAYLGPTAQSPTKDMMPYRLLLVKSRGIVAPGDVIAAPGGAKILILELSSDYDWAESYRAAYVSAAYPWTRRTVKTDPISLVSVDDTVTDMGTIYAYFDKPEAVMFEKDTVTKYRFLTGQDVQMGDTINSKNVKRIYDIMGVKAVEIE